VATPSPDANDIEAGRVSTRRADNSATDDDHAAPFETHILIPIWNGSRWSRIRFASAFTKAVPVMLG